MMKDKKVISWLLQHMTHEKKTIFGVFDNSHCLIQPSEAVYWVKDTYMVYGAEI